MDPFVVLRSLLTADVLLSDRATGASRRSAIACPRNDEGRLGLPRAAFRTHIASENPSREGPPRSRTGYRHPSLCGGADTSGLGANGRTEPGLLGAARLRTWFAGPGTTWGSLLDGHDGRRFICSWRSGGGQETKRIWPSRSIIRHGSRAPPRCRGLDIELVDDDEAALFGAAGSSTKRRPSGTTA
jgi:hypothetical protein